MFTNLLLADEINRTPPKTQAALLEAMEERQVTVEGQARPLPDPFIVVATQNPVEYEGTYPLPEAQLDRFLLKLQVGYPTAEQEQEVLRRHDAGPRPARRRRRRRAPGRRRRPTSPRPGPQIDDVRVEPPVLALHRRPGPGHPRVAVAVARRVAPRRGHAAARRQGVGVAGGPRRS